MSGRTRSSGGSAWRSGKRSASARLHRISPPRSTGWLRPGSSPRVAIPPGDRSMQPNATGMSWRTSSGSSPGPHGLGKTGHPEFLSLLPGAGGASRAVDPALHPRGPAVGETRVDLLHLLEDLRDAYPGALEETILTEIVANSLDSGARRIRLVADAAAAALVVADDGSGMRRP